MPSENCPVQAIIVRGTSVLTDDGYNPEHLEATYATAAEAVAHAERLSCYYTCEITFEEA